MAILVWHQFDRSPNRFGRLVSARPAQIPGVSSSGVSVTNDSETDRAAPLYNSSREAGGVNLGDQDVPVV